MNPLDSIAQAVASLTAQGQVFALENVEIRGHSYRSYQHQPANVHGYWNNAAASAAVFVDGWFHTEKLPRIASGKIFKRQLKADYAAELAS